MPYPEVVYKFHPGQILATPGALEAFKANNEDAFPYLQRHLSGDYGDICDSDKKLNDQAINDDSRILSAYNLPNGTRLWIITEGDRSVTTYLLPSEY